MKVIFNESFLIDTNKYNNVIELSYYVFGTYYKTVSSLKELFEDSYINGDSEKTEKQDLQSLRYSDDLLKIYIDMTESESEYLSNSSYELIYVYYRILGGEDLLGFVIIGDVDSNNIISPLELSINRNLINIPLVDCSCQLITNTVTDIKFLESIPVQVENIYANREGVISKNSYKKYIRSKKYVNSKMTPYLNTLGNEVSTNYIYRSYYDLNIYTKTSIPQNGEEIDESLKEEGGVVKILGSCKYIDYQIINKEISEVERGEVDLDQLLNISLVEVNKLNLVYTKINDIIKYEKLDNISSESFVVFKYIITYFNEIENKLIEIESNHLRLIQGDGGIIWEVSTNTPYSEQIRDFKYNLYLFENQSELEQEFNIITNLSFEESEIEVISENPELLNFFNVSVGKTSDGINVKIKTINTNETGNYYPQILSFFKIQLNDRFEQFYCIQDNYKLNTIVFYNDKYEEITDLIIPNDTKSSIVYFVEKNVNEQFKDNNYWVPLNQLEYLELIPNKGELNIGESSEWNNFVEIKYNSDFSTEQVYLGKQEIGRTNNLNLDITNWRDVINMSRSYLSISLQEEEPFLEAINSILIYDIGVYKYNIKSNFPFSLFISNTDSEKGIVKFHNSLWETRYDSGTFNKSFGIDVEILIDDLKGGVVSGLNIADITIRAESGGEQIQLTKLFQSKSEDYIDYVDPLENETLYVPISEFNTDKEITFISNKKCNSFEAESYINITEPTSVFNRDGYVYHKSTYRWEGLIDFYPIDSPQNVKIGVDGDTSVQNTYKIIGLGLDPDIYISSGSGSDRLKELGEDKYQVYLYNEVGIPIESTTIVIIESNYIINIGDGDGKSGDFIITQSDLVTVNISFVGAGEELEYRYYINLEPTENNLDTTETRYITEGYVESKIKGDSFIKDQIFSDEEVERIVGKKKINLEIVQRGQITLERVYLSEGDLSPVSPNGEIRSYELMEGSFEKVSEVTEIINFSHTLTEFIKKDDGDLQGIYNCVISSLLDDSYAPISIPLNSSDAQIREKIKYYTDGRINLGFQTTVESTLPPIVTPIYDTFTKELVQSGFKRGIIFSKLGETPKLFLGTNEVSNNRVSIELDNSETELLISLGMFELSSLSSGVVGINIDKEKNIIKSVESTIINQERIIPLFDGLADFRITILKNESLTTVTNTFTINISDEDGEIHGLILDIIQSAKILTLNSSISEGKLIRFHSSGYCSMNELNTSILDKSLITNIPLEKLEIVYDGYGEFDYSFNISENQSDLSNEFIRYEFVAKLEGNQSEFVRNGVIEINLINEDGSRSSLWSRNFSQGHITMVLEDKINSSIIENKSVIGSPSNPIIGDSVSTGTGNITIFPIKLRNFEIDADENLVEINTSNAILECEGIWEVYGSEVEVSTYLDNFESTIYNSYEGVGADDLPFLSEIYETKSIYYTSSILFYIENNLRVNYSFQNILNSNLLISPNFIFKLYLQKPAKN